MRVCGSWRNIAISPTTLVRSLIVLFNHRMDTQKSRWRQPGLIPTIAVVFLINLVVDWFVFQPTNLALLIVIEALVLGGIAWLVTAYASPRS